MFIRQFLSQKHQVSRVLYAFSLLETLLAISLMAMVVAIPFTLNTGTVYRVEAESAQSQVGHAYRRAMLYAQQSKNDSSWGVYIQNSSITVFAGSTYAARNAAFDDIISFDSKHVTMSVASGAAEVVFAKVTGTPSAAATISVSTASSPNKTVTLTTDNRVTYN